MKTVAPQGSARSVGDSGGTFSDLLTEVLRNGARTLLVQAAEAEVADFLAKHADLKTAGGRQRVVRHGHLPARAIMTGIGAVAVRQPRVHDRELRDGAPVRFTPSILPPYARRSKSLDVLIPMLYLKGVSTGDFEATLAALLGTDAPGLSSSALGSCPVSSTVARLKDVWAEEHARWKTRELSPRRHV
jgi:putative transposase